MTKQKAYSEKRFFEWHKDDLSVSLRNKGGSYGGGSEVLVVDNMTAVSIGNGQLHQISMEEQSNTLDTMHDKQAVMVKEIGMKSIVRRLTPLECERLQGFPDNWTLIGEPEEVEVKDYEYDFDEDGNEVGKRQVGVHTEIEYFYIDRFGKRKKCSDTARYRALGNSIAVGYANERRGFWMWLMKRISTQYERAATLGSLFDGIGGFPLAWEAVNGKGSALWASEIEEFCIEVTRRRFPDKDDEVADK